MGFDLSADENSGVIVLGEAQAAKSVHDQHSVFTTYIAGHIGNNHTRNQRQMYFQIKYTLDRMIGWLLLIPASPIIGFFWVLVRLTSSGPGFYLQTRVGLNGQLFDIVKLRSMRSDAEAGGQVQWCAKRDARMTPLGRLLRKLHIDELPQLWNVARGEMSLVGPRPERPEITQCLEQLIPDYYARCQVKPGITGLSQVNLEPDTNINITRQKQILDLRYIEQANLFLDARMLFATALRMLCIQGVYAMYFTGLKQDISDEELLSIGFEFDTPVEELWNPSKGMPVAPQLHAHTVSDSWNRIDSKSYNTQTSTELYNFNHEIPNAFTVDVEDYFQVTAFEERVCRKNWGNFESRVEANTDRLLQLLDQHQVLGTFFILGWVAERFPDLVKRIQRGGHELASHGYWHRLVYNQSPEDFATDLHDSREAIANACGVEVTAYRAPSFSITDRSMWALEILAEKGFTVDSSIFPIRGHDRYGVSGAKREIHEIQTESGSIVEFPPSAWHLPKINVPIGGGYFRIFPYSVSKQAIQQVRKQARPAMFYIHPWEIDPAQPRIAGSNFKSRFRHYTGLRSNYDRLSKLLATHRFATMDEVIREVIPSHHTWCASSGFQPQRASNLDG